MSPLTYQYINKRYKQGDVYTSTRGGGGYYLSLLTLTLHVLSLKPPGNHRSKGGWVTIPPPRCSHLLIPKSVRHHLAARIETQNHKWRWYCKDQLTMISIVLSVFEQSKIFEFFLFLIGMTFNPIICSFKIFFITNQQYIKESL